MLVDPLPVKSLSLAAATAITVLATDSFAVVDVAPGKSVRNGVLGNMDSVPAVLTISHSVSNENKPVKTDRTLIRLDARVAHPSGQEVTGSAYLVIATPRGCLDGNDDAVNWLNLVYALLGTFAVSPTAATLSNVNLARILAGEP